MNNQSEYFRILDRFPEPVIFHAGGEIIFANESALRLLNAADKSSVIGKNILDFIPEDYKDIAVERRIISENGALLDPIQVKALDVNNNEIFLDVISNVITDEGRKISQLIIRDVTQLKKTQIELSRLNRALRALLAINQSLFHASDEISFIQEVCRIIIDIGGYRLAWIGYLNHEWKTVRPVARGGNDDGLFDKINFSWDPEEADYSPAVLAVNSKSTQVFSDLKSLENDPEWKTETLVRGYNSFILLPLIHGEKVFGVVAVYSSRRNAFCSEEKQLLEQLARDLTYGIDFIREKADKKYAEQALKESEKRYREIFENDITGDFILSPEGDIISCNNSFLEIFEFGKFADVAGTNIGDLYSERLILKLLIDELKTEKRVSRRIVKMKTAYGRELTVIKNMIAIFDESGYISAIHGYLFDDTERTLYEEELSLSREELRRLAAHQEAAREEERKIVAREIHDELGQNLTGLKMDISFIKDLAKQSEDSVLRDELLKKIDSAASLLDSTVKSVRRISTNLRPAVLDSLGLIAAIEWQAEDFQNRMGIECDCYITMDSVDLSSEISSAVFRILQESLTNIKKHSAASKAVIEFYSEEEMYILRIRDNGKGIRNEDFHKKESFGILGMKERSHLFNGSVEISSSQNNGTTVEVRIPITKSGRNK